MLFNTKDDSTILGSIVKGQQNKKQYAADMGMYKRVIADIGIMANDQNNNPDWFKTADLSQYTGMSDTVRKELEETQKELIKTGKTGTDAIGVIQEKMEATGKEATKLGNQFAGIGKAIVNGLASAAIAAAVSFAVTQIAKGIKWLWDEVFTDNAESKRREEASTRMQDRISSNKQEVESLDSLVDEYTKLNEKINDADISVTELLQTKEELLGIQDSLKDKYGKEAEAIDLVNGKYDEEIEKLKEIEKRKSRDFLYGDEGALRKDDRGKSDYERNLETLYAKPKMQSLTLSNGRQIGKNESLNDYFGFDIESILSKYTDISLTKEKVVGARGGQGAWDNIVKFAFSPDVTAEQADKILTELFAELDAQYVNNPEVQRFKDQLQSLANNIDFDSSEFEASLDNSKYTIEQILAASDDTDESILDQLSKAVGDYNKALADYELTGTTEAKEALEQSLDNLNEIEAKARDLQTYDPQSFARITSYGDDSLRLYNQMIDEALERKSLTISDRLDKKMADADSKVYASYKQQRDSLSESEQKAFESLLPEDVQILTLKDFTDLINEAKRIAAENPIELEVEPKTKFSEQTSSLDELEKSFSGLATTYDTTVNQKIKVDASDLEKVNSDMGGVTFNVKDEDVDKINSMSNAIEAYDQTLIQSAGDAEAAQTAADKLATAYVDQSDVLDNLIDHMDDVTDAQKKYVQEQLEANGIQNAEEVITTRLTKRYKAYSAALVEVSKTMAQYRNDVEASIKTGQDSNGVASKMKDSVTAMLSTYDDQGNAIITPQIDEKFIVDNLAQIKAATEGDVAAFDELMAKVAELNAMQVFIDANIDEETAAAQAANIMGMIAQANAMDIEVGASIDDSAFLSALNEMIQSSEQMADAVSKAFESMGYKVAWNSKSTRAMVPVYHGNLGGMMNTQGANSGGISNNPAYGAMEVSTKEMTFTFPELQITRVGSASGAGAIYGGHSGGSSGGGGGGGGGGGASEPTKPKEESEESFDWIEVAIQRIEEEIARLDKVVGNSYDIWINRNEALLKEINKTKEEIKAQEIAYKEYLRNANEVKVNNGKGLNADDYGENDKLVKEQDERLLAEAQKAWATGEYQKKVREGLMTGKDIETIQNHFLSDAIKQYQEIFNKAVNAKDAIQDLNIKLGDLARTNFDHAKTEAEEAISYFESYADLINERISRTEERGYFVTKSYQAELAKFEKERLALLRNEYNELIKKRDEAVQNGYIKAYSSEWNSLNQEILGVGKSIEEATTNLVKFNNEMRQHDWDVFDYTQERIGKITEEFDFLIDLLDNQKLYDDYGAFNKRGWADTALHAGKYNTYMQQSLDYAKERAKIEKELAKDEGNKNLIERREELIKLQQESIQNAYAEKEAVKDLVEQGINIHLQKLTELIDKYKQSLHNAKDLYTYQKNIASQTENITKLQKQLAAYEGDTSEETRATVQRLRKSLDDAQTQLKETQWDKYISETEEFLSDMYEEYEKVLNKRLEDIDLLMHDMIGEVNARGTEIKSAINGVTKDVAYKMTENATTFLNTGTLVSDFKKKFDTYATTMQDSIGDVKDYIKRISENSVASQVNGQLVKGTNVRVSTVRNGVDYSDVFDINYYMEKYTDLQKAFGADYDKYLDHFIKYGMKEGRQAIETFNVATYMKNYQDLRDAYQKDLEKYYYHYIKAGKKEKRKAYATGSHNITSNQLAWTQDGGGELIYRSSDGAVLTPLNIGDKVFTNEMSENLWKLAQLKPTIPTGNSRTITNNNAIAITLPNVTNYEQFKTQLQNDPKMTQFIQQITIGEANGMAKLNKRKF